MCHCRSFPQLHDGGAGSSFRLGSGIEAADVFIFAKQVTDSLLEDSHAVTVYDADAIDGSESGGIEELVYFVDGLFGTATDNVELAVGGVPTRAGFDADVFHGAPFFAFGG